MNELNCVASGYLAHHREIVVWESLLTLYAILYEWVELCWQRSCIFIDMYRLFCVWDITFVSTIKLMAIHVCPHDRQNFHAVPALLFLLVSDTDRCYPFTSGLFHLVTVITLRPRQNGRRFADDTFKRIFLNENVRISIEISLKLVPKGPISNIPALVQIMAWRRSGDKPLSEPMMVSLLTHICVTRPQRVILFTVTYKISVWLKAI